MEALGVSILGGGITTLGAGSFMIPAVISIFWRSGILIVTTILFSLFYSLFYFNALCIVFGPEEEKGSLKPGLKKITGACFKKK